MSLAEDLKSEVAEIFSDTWEDRDGSTVPEDNDIGLGNDAVKLKATVLYADLADSTKLVDRYKPSFAAEIYKTFLHCAAKIIRSEGGEITAYDGDRIMAVYLGSSKNTSAVRSALKIKFAAERIISPAKQRQYSDNAYELRHTVGIDTSDLLVARTGVRGANDLVWVGRAANYAAKLSACSGVWSTYITPEVYDVLNTSARTSDGKSMWDQLSWTEFDGRTIYGSTWWWSIEWRHTQVCPRLSR